MIPVQQQPEPKSFGKNVRTPGARWLSGLAMPPQSQKEWKGHEYWHKCLNDLYACYNGICAYYAIYIDMASGYATVDHFVPKSADPQQAYEWNNYRLSSFRPNSAKRDAVSIMDPFALRKWTFFINFSNGEVRPNDRLPVDEKIKVDETIKILKLNASEITRKRAEDFSAYIAGMVTLEYLVKYSPFVAEEITRQHLELA